MERKKTYILKAITVQAYAHASAQFILKAEKIMQLHCIQYFPINSIFNCLWLHSIAHVVISLFHHKLKNAAI